MCTLQVDPRPGQGKRAWSELFTRYLFPLLLQHQGEGLLPVLAGDWICVLSEKDTTLNFKDKFSRDLDQMVKTFKYVDFF